MLLETFLCKCKFPKLSFLVDWYYGKMDEKAKGFFCSQLIADAFMYARVLPENMVAETYG
jgi:hypothetical protein